MASTTSPIGSEIDLDVRIIVGNPRSTAASATTRTAISTDAVFGMSQPFERTTTSATMTSARQRAAQQPQQNQAREHTGRRDEALRRVGRGGKDRANELHRQQKADARRGGSAQDDAESGRDDDAGPAADIEQDGDCAADHPGTREEHRLASEHPRQPFSLTIVWFEAGIEPPQRRRDVQDATHRDHDRSDTDQHRRGDDVSRVK